MNHGISSVLVAMVGVLGCASGDPVSIGDNQPAKTGERLSDYAAGWDGYTEAYAFASGSDRVRLSLDENGQGYLEVGDAPLLEPPTDPDIAYPGSENGVARNSSIGGIVEGFRYSVLGAAVNERRIRFGVWGHELYADWCELQTPVASHSGAADYNCVDESLSGGSRDGVCYQNTESGEVSIDCGKLRLCSSYVCICDAEQCTGTTPALGQMTGTQLDGALEQDGNELVGTLMIDGNRVNLRLTRSTGQ
jgi:hypothetical protein